MKSIVNENLSEPEEQEDESVNAKGEKGKRENRDHCNVCKDGGDLVCCDNCPRSFHLNCLKLQAEEIPDEEWYCVKCM